MEYQSLSDTHIVCAPVPINNRQIETVFDVQTSGFPISWYGTLDTLESMPHAIGSVCLEMHLKDIASKHQLRMQLHAARRSFPNLKTIVAPKAGQVHYHDLLVEEGISVILTQSFSTISSPRRPTPMGWPCRNVQWGLWEVSRDTPKQKGQIQKFLSSIGRKGERPGTLRVWDAASPKGTYDHKKFSRAIRRIHKLVSKKSETVISLDQIPECISSNSSREVPTSILKAA